MSNYGKDNWWGRGNHRQNPNAWRSNDCKYNKPMSEYPVKGSRGQFQYEYNQYHTSNDQYRIPPARNTWDQQYQKLNWTYPDHQMGSMPPSLFQRRQDYEHRQLPFENTHFQGKRQFPKWNDTASSRSTSFTSFLKEKEKTPEPLPGSEEERKRKVALAADRVKKCLLNYQSESVQSNDSSQEKSNLDFISNSRFENNNSVNQSQSLTAEDDTTNRNDSIKNDIWKNKSNFTELDKTQTSSQKKLQKRKNGMSPRTQKNLSHIPLARNTNNSVLHNEEGTIFGVNESKEASNYSRNYESFHVPSLLNKNFNSGVNQKRATQNISNVYGTCHLSLPKEETGTDSGINRKRKTPLIERTPDSFHPSVSQNEDYSCSITTEKRKKSSTNKNNNSAHTFTHQDGDTKGHPDHNRGNVKNFITNETMSSGDLKKVLTKINDLKTQIFQQLSAMSKTKLEDLITNPHSQKFELAMKYLVKEHQELILKKQRHMAHAKIRNLNAGTDIYSALSDETLPVDPSASIDLVNLPQELVDHLSSLLNLDLAAFDDSSQKVSEDNISAYDLQNLEELAASLRESKNQEFVSYEQPPIKSEKLNVEENEVDLSIVKNEYNDENNLYDTNNFNPEFQYSSYLNQNKQNQSHGTLPSSFTEFCNLNKAKNTKISSGNLNTYENQNYDDVSAQINRPLSFNENKPSDTDPGFNKMNDVLLENATVLAKEMLDSSSGFQDNTELDQNRELLNEIPSKAKEVRVEKPISREKRKHDKHKILQDNSAFCVINQEEEKKEQGSNIPVVDVNLGIYTEDEMSIKNIDKSHFNKNIPFQPLHDDTFLHINNNNSEVPCVLETPYSETKMPRGLSSRNNLSADKRVNSEEQEKTENISSHKEKLIPQIDATSIIEPQHLKTNENFKIGVDDMEGNRNIGGVADIKITPKLNDQYIQATPSLHNQSVQITPVLHDQHVQTSAAVKDKQAQTIFAVNDKQSQTILALNDKYVQTELSLETAQCNDKTMQTEPPRELDPNEIQMMLQLLEKSSQLSPQLAKLLKNHFSSESSCFNSTPVVSNMNNVQPQEDDIIPLQNSQKDISRVLLENSVGRQSTFGNNGTYIADAVETPLDVDVDLPNEIPAEQCTRDLDVNSKQHEAHNSGMQCDTVHVTPDIEKMIFLEMLGIDREVQKLMERKLRLYLKLRVQIPTVVNTLSDATSTQNEYNTSVQFQGISNSIPHSVDNEPALICQQLISQQSGQSNHSQAIILPPVCTQNVFSSSQKQLDKVSEQFSPVYPTTSNLNTCVKVLDTSVVEAVLDTFSTPVSKHKDNDSNNKISVNEESDRSLIHVKSEPPPTNETFTDDGSHLLGSGVSTSFEKKKHKQKPCPSKSQLKTLASDFKKPTKVVSESSLQKKKIFANEKSKPSLHSKSDNETLKKSKILQNEAIKKTGTVTSDSAFRNKNYEKISHSNKNDKFKTKVSEIKNAGDAHKIQTMSKDTKANSNKKNTKEDNQYHFHTVLKDTKTNSSKIDVKAENKMKKKFNSDHSRKRPVSEILDDDSMSELNYNKKMMYEKNKSQDHVVPNSNSEIITQEVSERGACKVSSFEKISKNKMISKKTGINAGKDSEASVIKTKKKWKQQKESKEGRTSEKKSSENTDKLVVDDTLDLNIKSLNTEELESKSNNESHEVLNCKNETVKTKVPSSSLQLDSSVWDLKKCSVLVQRLNETTLRGSTNTSKVQHESQFVKTSPSAIIHEQSNEPSIASACSNDDSSADLLQDKDNLTVKISTTECDVVDRNLDCNEHVASKSQENDEEILVEDVCNEHVTSKSQEDEEEILVEDDCNERVTSKSQENKEEILDCNEHAANKSQENDEEIPVVEDDEHLSFGGHEGTILDLKVFQSYLYAASDNGTIYSYSLESGKLSTIYEGHKDAVTCLVVLRSNTQNLLFSGSLDTTVHCFNLEGGDTDYKSYDVEHPVSCMEQNWGNLYIGTKVGTVVIYDIEKGELVGDAINLCDDTILSLKTTKEGARKVLIIGTRNSPVSVRDANNGLLLRTMSREWSHTAYSLMMYESNIYCGTASGIVSVFEFTTGEEVSRLKAGGGVTHIKIYKDMLLASCYDGNVYIFNLQDKSLLTKIPGPGKMLLSMDIVKDQLFVGCKEEKQLVSWSLPDIIKTQGTK